MAKYRAGLRSARGAPAVSAFPNNGGVASLTGGSPFTLGTSFLAIDISESFFVPPDTQFAVGPTQILAIANGRIKVFDRDGNVGALNVDTATFFSSVTANGVSDPRVRYDRLTGRWFVIMIDVPSPRRNNKILIAVSNGSEITDTTSFTFFSFQQNAASPTGDANRFADYPTLGIDRLALYIGCNMFNTSDFFTGTTGFVINKSNLLAGTLTVTAFRGLGTSVSAGPYTPQGVDNDDPNATQGYFIGVDTTVKSRLVLRRVNNPGGTPTISGNINITVPTTVLPLGGVPTLGGSSLDDLDDRLFAATLKNGRLWTAHNIEVNASGIADPAGNRNGVRWYEITNLTGTAALKQSGTLFNTNASNPASYFIPTIAMSGQGHALIGCSVAGASQHAEIAVATRLATDPAGTMSAPAVVQTSPFTYNQGGAPDRWGDYSRVLVDPLDDMTFWTAQEYASGPSAWGVRIIQFKAPAPAAPIACSPSTLFVGTTTNVTLVGSASSGTGFFDPAPSFPKHIAASLGADVTVNSISYSNATNITLNLTIAPGAATGGRFITVTNPDGQFVTSDDPLVNISEANVLPAISGIADQTIDEDTVTEAVAFTVEDFETAAGSLMVSATSSDTNLFPTSAMVLSNSGTNRSVTLTPATNRFGTAIIRIVVADAAAGTATNTFTVLVNPVNDAPVLPPISTVSIAEGNTLLLTNSATDVESNALMYSLGAEAPTNMSISASSGVLTWTPTEAQGPTTNLITVIVTEDGVPGLSATQFIAVIVNEVNIAPVLAAISNRVVYAGETVSFNASATDSDVPGNGLSFTLQAGAPTNAAISASGVFSWSTTNSDAGSRTIGVRVTDDGVPVLSDVKTFDVTVLDPPTVNIAVNETNVTLSWNAIAGRTYRVQFKTDASAAWDDLPGDVSATGATAAKSDVIVGDRRFYRVLVLP